jgi:peptide/nickel transport system ATP-binding protein
MTSERPAAETHGPGVRAEEQPLVEIAGLRKYFSQSSGFLDRLVGTVDPIRAVDGVDLDVRRGETVAVVGESGCGKSTLGRTILGLDEATAGSVRYHGTDLTELSRGEMKPYRSEMQMIFQDPLKSLNPRQSIRQILTAPMEVHDIGEDGEDRVERATDLLRRVDLKPDHIDRYPHQLSGGQQQRVALARALTMDPEFLVADEPVSGLDVSIQAKILNLLEGLQDEFGLTVLLISHDLRVVRHVADRVFVMYLGEIVESAPVAELFENPRHPYTMSLLSSIPRMERDANAERIILRGTVPSASDPPAGCRFHTRCPEVIPPAGWPGTQASFRDGFTFRRRIETEEFDLDTTRARLEAEGAATDDDALVDHVVEQTLPGDVEELPADAREAVVAAAGALVEGRDDRAASLARETFRTPCEDDHPGRTELDGGQYAFCHRLDPDAPGDPEF